MSDSDFQTSSRDEEIVSRSRVVLDGDLSEGKLLSLIRLEREEESLDYKRGYDLAGKRVTKDKLEMVADVVAMANTSGGYIVLGVDEDRSGTAAAYRPSGILQDHLEALDPEKLGSQVNAYLGVPVNFKLQRHYLDDYEGKCFALIYVEESPHSPIIMIKDGQYEKDGRTTPVFRAGDVIIRRGTSTQRVDQNDMRALVSKMRRRERERWTEEILGVRGLTERLDRLIEALGGEAGTPRTGGASGRAGRSHRHEASDFFLGNSAFEGVVFEALRMGDELGIRWYLNNAPAAFYDAVEEAAGSEAPIRANIIRDDRLEPLLDNLAVLAIVCARYRRAEFLVEVRDALYGIYQRAHATDFDRPALRVEVRRSWVWEAVMKRVYAIGAYLLRLGLHHEVPHFIRQPVTWEHDLWRRSFWARHALTMRSRDGGLARQGLCAVTEDYVERREWFYREFGEDKDGVISSLCQFDFLQCVHAIDDAEDYREAYPSFGVFYNERTEPVISLVLRDEAARRALLPEMSDERLAGIIKHLDTAAAREFWAFNGWDADSWRDRKVREFLSRYPAPTY